LSFLVEGARLNAPESSTPPVCPAADSLFFAMAKKSDPMCAECEQLWRNYGDASLKRVRAYGNLKLANLRSDLETMEMLAEAAALATQKLEEVKRKIQEHESTLHAFRGTQSALL
jgi:hypothetical protein